MVVDVLFFGITTEGIMRPYEPDHNKVFSPIIYSVCLVYMATIPFLGLVQIFYHLKIPMIYSWGVFISEKLSFYPSIVVYYSLPHQGPTANIWSIFFLPYVFLMIVISSVMGVIQYLRKERAKYYFVST